MVHHTINLVYKDSQTLKPWVNTDPPKVTQQSFGYILQKFSFLCGLMGLCSGEIYSFLL